MQRKIWKTKYVKEKKYRRVKHHSLYTAINRGAVHSLCHLQCGTTNDISVDVHNGSILWLPFYHKRASKIVWGRT